MAGLSELIVCDYKGLDLKLIGKRERTFYDANAGVSPLVLIEGLKL